MPAVDFHCDRYVSCPLCSKCRNAASHLLQRCVKCSFGKNPCHHTDEEINMMIKRRNFTLPLTEEAKKQIKELIDANDRRSED